VTVGLIVALALAVLIGVSLGTLGSGGAIITMPVLVYVARIPTHTAVGMSLVVVGTTAAVGSYLQSRTGGFDRRSAVIVAATKAMPFSSRPAVIPGPRSGTRNPVRVTTLDPGFHPGDDM